MNTITYPKEGKMTVNLTLKVCKRIYIKKKILF